jgi:SAM-dependent methyltransferase
MDEHVEGNRRLWDAWTPYHVRSPFYDVEGFTTGRSRRRAGLDDLEIGLVGDVTGKTLLHLQCHFGLDTLAWARRGARVTGVDFSAPAIAAARALAAETRIEATFVESDVYALPANLDGRFDVVFTSHGVLGWLPDLEGWARVVAHFLAPGGRFVLIEGHPFALIFDERPAGPELRVRYPYFQGPAPVREECQGSYAAPDAPLHGVQYTWIHPLADVLGSLLRAGLRIDAFAEYPYVGWAMFPWMEQRPDRCWQLPGGAGTIPLMFSLTASKAAGPAAG